MYWFLKWIVLGPFVRLLARPTVTGRLPKGPVILAPNHRTEVESLVLGIALPRRITFVAKSDYFDRGALGARFYGLICRATGQIPISRAGNGVDDPALDAARGVLDSGGVWVIYPEGTRSPDARLHRGHTGVMRVALSRPNATVVPVGILGVETVGLRRGRVEIRLGAPLDLARWRDRADDPAAWREATDALMQEIRALTGQEYVDRYPTGDEIARRNAA